METQLTDQEKTDVTMEVACVKSLDYLFKASRDCKMRSHFITVKTLKDGNDYALMFFKLNYKYPANLSATAFEKSLPDLLRSLANEIENKI